MTLQEAKDQVAKNYGYDSWWNLDFTNVSEEAARDEVSMLYARSKWDEAIEEHKESISNYMGSPFNAPKPEFKP